MTISKRPLKWSHSTYYSWSDEWVVLGHHKGADDSTDYVAAQFWPVKPPSPRFIDPPVIDGERVREPEFA